MVNQKGFFTRREKTLYLHLDLFKSDVVPLLNNPLILGLEKIEIINNFRLKLIKVSLPQNWTVGVHA